MTPRKFIQMVALLPAVLATMAATDDAPAVPDFKAKIDVVWGTDDSKPADKNYMEIDPKSREKLKPFRWKNYWVVKTETTDVSPTTKKLYISDGCILELKKTDTAMLEVKVYDRKAGPDPKLVKTVHHSVKALRKGEYCIIAGDDKSRWGDAWFLIVTESKQ